MVTCERNTTMALDLYMIGLITEDMGKSLEFYRRLGLTRGRHDRLG